MSWRQWLFAAISNEIQAEEMDATAEVCEVGDPDGYEQGRYDHWRQFAAEARFAARVARWKAADEWDKNE